MFQYRTYKNFDDEKYMFDIFQTFNSCDFSDGNVNVCARWFVNSLSDIIDIHAPFRTKVCRDNNAVSMNQDWRRANHKRNMARNTKDLFPSDANFENYRKLRNESTKLRTKSRQIYFQERCEGGEKNQHFWKTVKPFLSAKYSNSSNSISLLENNTIITDVREVCDLFNTYFKTIADHIGFNHEIPDDFSDDNSMLSMFNAYESHPSIMAIHSHKCPDVDDFQLQPVSVDYVFNLLEDLNIRKGTGCDLIPAKLVKKGSAPLAQCLTDLINMSIEECQFPDPLKLAEIAPLFKKENDLMKENYRPVSVLTIISKIVERCYADQLGIFFENKFSAFLSAYRRRYGCQSALLRMIELWRQALDQGHFVGAVAMDLSKAFDSVPHALLIAKLRAYGVGIKTCKLFSSYLSNRYQRVRLHGEKSEWENITRGFPQGSILGPLFLMSFSMMYFGLRMKQIYLISLMTIFLVSRIRKFQ